MIRTVVVDDEEDARRINRKYVEDVPGFVVTGVARSGREALAVVNNQPVDLVLLDFHLPDMDGLDVCYALRDPRRPLVDIIAVTVANDTGAMRALRAYGVVQYLIKPCRRAHFRKKLQAYARYFDGLLSGQTFSQCECDILFGELHVPPNTALPKGLTPSTYKLIADTLRRADRPLPATEIAQATGTPPLNRCTARHYLAHLHQQGFVALTVRYGTRGRPRHYYRWVGPEHE